MSDGVDDPERLGNKLRVAREAKGYSQIDLGALTGYSNGWISSVERGVAIPTSTFVRRMEIVLHVDLGASDYVVRRIKRGDVGDWGMTPTEVAGYVGLSRTRIYELLGKYSELEGDGLGSVDLYKGYLPWVSVDGYRRVNIEDCARWKVYDSTEWKTLDESELEELIGSEMEAIRTWLGKRRQR